MSGRVRVMEVRCAYVGVTDGQCVGVIVCVEQ